eukprot:6187436-Pleurochrysis_carterae.AAC.7
MDPSLFPSRACINRICASKSASVASDPIRAASESTSSMVWHSLGSRKGHTRSSSKPHANGTASALSIPPTRQLSPVAVKPL